MKGTGIDNSLQFILTENAPILEVRGNKVEESSKKLVSGTIVKGNLKTRIVSMGKKKVPFRFIQLNDKKGYLSPQVVNVYVGHFANLDGLNPKTDGTPTKDTSFGQTQAGKKGKTKSFVINYALPVAGGVIGYKIANKMGGDDKKILGYVLFFGLLGCIPRYLYKKK